MAIPLPPRPSPGYVGMLVLTCLAMLVGIVCMALEASEYDWDPKPKAAPKIELPKSLGTASLDVPPATVAEAKPEPKPTAVAEVKPEPKPAPVAKAEVPVEPKPAPVVPPVATVKIEPAPPGTGPVPSPLNLNRPKPTTPAATETPKTPEEPKPEQPKPTGPTQSPLRIGR